MNHQPPQKINHQDMNTLLVVKTFHSVQGEGSLSST